MSALKKHIFLSLYIVLGTIYFYFDILNQKQVLQYIIPSLITILTVYYLTSAAKKYYDYLFIIMLIFQLIADLTLSQFGQNDFIYSLSLYFVVKLLLILIVTNKIGIIQPNDIYLIFVPIVTTLLVIVYIIFASIELLQILLFMFTLVVSVLLSLAFHYYYKSKKESAKFFLIGIISYVICDIFSGLNQLVKPDIYYDAINTLAYLIALFCITYSMILDAKESKNTLN